MDRSPLPPQAASLATAIAGFPVRLTVLDTFTLALVHAQTEARIFTLTHEHVSADTPIRWIVAEMCHLPADNALICALLTSRCGPRPRARDALEPDAERLATAVESLESLLTSHADVRYASTDPFDDLGGVAGLLALASDGHWIPVLDALQRSADERHDPARSFVQGVIAGAAWAHDTTAFVDLLLGLVRGAEMIEQRDGGSIWDDQVRAALAAARALGWGAGRIGSLPGARAAA
jgi:hypothetical protein